MTWIGKLQRNTRIFDFDFFGVCPVGQSNIFYSTESCCFSWDVIVVVALPYTPSNIIASFRERDSKKWLHKTSIVKKLSTYSYKIQTIRLYKQRSFLFSMIGKTVNL